MLAWLMAVLLILIGLASIYLYSTSFKLGNWKYDCSQVETNNLPDKPNILLLVAEDMSARVGAFGDSLALTPNIDKLAARGVRFPNTFTTAGVCAPSRAALILGMNQISTGTQHMRTSGRPNGGYQSVPPPEVKAFPELLRGAGYYTFNAAKEDYQFSGTTPGSGPFTIWDAENDPNLWRSRQKNQPFFGMVNFMETHETGLFTPLGNKPNSLIHFVMQLFRPMMVLSTEGEEVDPSKISLPPYYPNTPLVRADIARLYSNVNAMDGVVGDIINRLERDGLASSTIVIWTTDHGDCLPRAKRDLYDSGIKVPMVIYWPEAYRPKNMKTGTVDERLISFVDLAPTLLGFTNTEKPNYLEGIDIVNDTIPRSFVFAARDRIDEIDDRQRAVRSARFKYIRSWHPDQAEGVHLEFRDNLEIMKEMWRMKAAGKLNADQLKWFQSPGKERLYDIENDPFELHNLSGDINFSEDLGRLRNALDGWLEQIDDWSEMSEDKMVTQFQPNGQQEVTPKPTILIENDKISITSEETNVSIGYQVNNDPWMLYTGPFALKNNVKITAKAIRYGWKESDEVEINL